jgi:hypothetical protein
MVVFGAEVEGRTSFNVKTPTADRPLGERGDHVFDLSA